MNRAIIAPLAALSLLWASTGQAQPAPPSPPPPPPIPSAPTPPAPAPPPHHLDRCPDNLLDFENSDATSKLVQQCLGRPERTMPGRGSDSVWFYSVKNGTITVVCVFDKTGALTHFRAYAHN